MFDKNNHHNVLIFQQIEFLIAERHCDSTIIQRVHTYYLFLQRVFFCFFQIDDLIKTKYVFSHFVCTFFHNEMFMPMMT